jgi:hypothetical protein
LLFNANSTIFQLYHGENKLIFDEEMMMRSALFWTNTLSWIFILLAHSGQTKDYKIGICCFSAKRAALRSNRKDCLARIQNNVSE